MRAGTITVNGSVRSEGQRMLLAVTGTLAAIAAELGAKTAAVHRWKTGVRIPTPQARARMQEAFGIPAHAWSVRPGAAQLTAELVAQQAELAGTPGAVPTTLDECMALLTTLRRDRMRQGLMPSELVKLTTGEAGLLKLRHQLEEAAKFAEAKYVMQHPAWLRLKRAILKALEQHPEAARAVADAIANIEGQA